METISFMDKCKGIGYVLTRAALVLGVVLFGTAAILFSTAPAQADAPETMYATGKYQMAITSSVDANNDIFWYILVWDSETGRSKIYCGSPSINKTVAGSGAYNLPSSPL